MTKTSPTTSTGCSLLPQGRDFLRSRSKGLIATMTALDGSGHVVAEIP